MRKACSAFTSGPGLPGIQTLGAGVVTLAVVGWLMLSADGRIPDDGLGPQGSAPPANAALATPQGIDSALASTVDRQQVLLSGLRGRLETGAADLTRVAVEVAAMRARLGLPAHLPAAKPDAASAPPSPERLAELERTLVHLQDTHVEVRRRIANAEAFIAQALTLMRHPPEAPPDARPGDTAQAP